MEENMKKSMLIVIAMLLLFPLISFGGEWETAADLGLELNQAYYSDNWAGGETGILSWTARANVTANKAFSEEWNNNNTIKLAFGQTYTQDQETDDWGSPEKAVDKIDIESLFRYITGGFVDPYGAIRFESQFYDNRIPGDVLYINPMLITESVGASKTLFKEEKSELRTRVGAAVRQNVDRNRDKFSEIDEAIIDAGAEWVTDYNITFAEDKMKFESKLSVYQALYNSEEDKYEPPAEDYWKATDVNWENSLSVAVAKYVQVALYSQLLYDKEIDRTGRFRQNLALGLTYKLF
jgi:DUF3078 family protein